MASQIATGSLPQGRDGGRTHGRRAARALAAAASIATSAVAGATVFAGVGQLTAQSEGSRRISRLPELRCSRPTASLQPVVVLRASGGRGSSAAFVGAVALCTSGAISTGRRRRAITANGRQLRLAMASAKIGGQIHVGMAVKVVSADITLWHVPGWKGKAYNPQDLEGEIVSIVEGGVTANRPILVKLSKAPTEKMEGFKAFSAHFAEDEIAVGDQPAKSEEASVADARVTEATPTGQSGSAGSDDGQNLRDLLMKGGRKRTMVFAGAETLASSLADDKWVINLLYDRQSPTCMKQVEFLQKRMDEDPQFTGLVHLTDLHAPDYDPELCGGGVF
mmetsp:Transcript_44222/g.80114  ORF Transcript_44222/g.80114 Transcript_44222/m.80114 type:complete len:335 (-) Transcript_44222:3-1007(-)